MGKWGVFQASWVDVIVRYQDDVQLEQGKWYIFSPGGTIYENNPSDTEEEAREKLDTLRAGNGK